MGGTRDEVNEALRATVQPGIEAAQAANKDRKKGKKRLPRQAPATQKTKEPEAPAPVEVKAEPEPEVEESKPSEALSLRAEFKEFKTHVTSVLDLDPEKPGVYGQIQAVRNGFSDQVTTLREEVTTALSSFEERIEKVETRVTAVEKRVSEIQGRLDEAELMKELELEMTDIPSTPGRLEALEGVHTFLSTWEGRYQA